jgi:hypothetical protein
VVDGLVPKAKQEGPQTAIGAALGRPSGTVAPFAAFQKRGLPAAILGPPTARLPILTCIAASQVTGPARTGLDEVQIKAATATGAETAWRLRSWLPTSTRHALLLVEM